MQGATAVTDMLPSATRILVVDDDPSLIVLLSRMLVRIGVPPQTAQTGKEALELLYAGHYDLLILDLMLPDIDGFEILSRIRNDPRFDSMPVLILSAIADPDGISKGLALGADGYLTKPYLPNTLTSRVRALLEQGRRKPDSL
jgi:DNA-binding response OmpR family regulator